MMRRLALGAALVLVPVLWWQRCLAADFRLVALTFDDGPAPTYTEQILRVLAEERVRATFLFMGQHAEQLPHLVRTVAAAGHEIGSHTYSHPSLGSLSAERAAAEIEHGRRAVERVAGRPVRLLRAPYGHEPPFLSGVCDELAITLIPFGVPGYDWLPRTSLEIADEIVRSVSPGDYILLHDGSHRPDYDRTETVAAVRLLVRRLRARGYRFVTASELRSVRATPAFVSHDLGRRALSRLRRMTGDLI